jgi:hypothetical protein
VRYDSHKWINQTHKRGLVTPLLEEHCCHVKGPRTVLRTPDVEVDRDGDASSAKNSVMPNYDDERLTIMLKRQNRFA